MCLFSFSSESIVNRKCKAKRGRYLVCFLCECGLFLALILKVVKYLFICFIVFSMREFSIRYGRKMVYSLVCLLCDCDSSSVIFKVVKYLFVYFIFFNECCRYGRKECIIYFLCCVSVV